MKYYIFIGKTNQNHWFFSIRKDLLQKNKYLFLICLPIRIPNILGRKKSLFLFEQLYLLQGLGLSIVQSFELLCETPKPCCPRYILADIYHQICQGIPLNQCFQHQGLEFSSMSRAFLNIAHESGQFFKLMHLWFVHEKRLRDFKNKIQQQLSYPLVLILLLVLLLIFFYQHMLPQYLLLMQQMNVDPPKSLVICVKIKKYFLPSLISLTSLGFIFFKKIINQLSFKKTLDWWIWSSTMKICLQAKINWLESLNLILGNFSNLHQKTWMIQTQKKLRLGLQLDDCFQGTPLIIQQYLPILKKAESSEVVFEKLADYFQFYLEKQIKRIEQYLQPLLLLGIASIAGLMIWLMYQPLFVIGQQI
jgi:type II secretory pathway component PulF